MKIEQRIKKTIAVILILVFLTQQIPAIPAYASGNTSVWDGSIASAYASGTGSEADPYIIKSASQFARISQEVSCGNEVDKYYELSADVDLNSLNWIPIGNDEYPFKGYFNGKGHVITNMHVSAIQSGTTKSKRTLFDVRLEDVGKSRSKENVIVEDPITKELIQQTRELDDEIKKVAEEERRIVEENTEKSKARESDNNRNENVESPIAPSNEGNIKEQQVEEPLLGIEKQEESIEEVGDEILDEGKKEEKDLEPDEEVEIEEFSEADEEEPKEGVKDELADIVKDEGAGSNEDVSNVNSDGIQMAKSELNKIENAFKEEVEDGNRKKASRATSYATQFPGYEADAGLFGYFYSGVIESVFVTNSGVTGQRYCGGIAGYSGTNAVIKKCYFDGVVDSSISGCIGGIVGYSEGRINVCYNRGTIGQYSGSGSYVGGIVGGSGFVTESMNTGNIYGNNSYMGGISGTIIGNKMVLECINYGSVGTSVTQGGFVGGIVGHAKDGYVSKSANHGKVMATSSSSANCFIGGLAGDAYVVSNSYNVAEVSGCWAAGLGGVLIGGSLKSYNAGTIEGEMNAAVTCLLEANGTVSRNSTFFRQDSAPIAIRHNAAGFLGGVAVGVRADLMKDINWIEGVLQTPFVIDSNNINNGYAILDVVNYTPDEPRPIEGHMKEDTFHFASAREKGSPEEYDDYEGMFYYSDAYFRSDASIYNPSLATMSLCLAISGFNSNSWGPTGDKYKNKHKNVEELMDKIGFSEIAVSADYEIKPEKNTFGVVVGHKEVQVDGRKKSLIVLVGRGGGYEAEWGGNLTLGETGEHKGFSDAKDVAYNHLADYVMQHRDESWFHEEDVLFWITGYSRAAAVTNLLSGQLTTELSISGVSFSNEDLYAYCMAPPMGAIEGVSEQADKIYTNIHNIINPCDLVPKVAPEVWNFTRYGVNDSVIPDQLTTANSGDFERLYIQLGEIETYGSSKLFTDDINKEFKLNTFQDIHIKLESGIGTPIYQVAEGNDTMSIFLDKLISSLTTGLQNRSYYVQEFQDAFSDLAAEAFRTPETRDRWLEVVPVSLKTNINDNLDIIISVLISQGIDTAYELVLGFVYQAVQEADIDVDREIIHKVFGVVIRSLLDNILSEFGSDIITLMHNAKLLSLPHYPELYFAWLQIQDPNYDGVPKTYTNSYRTVSVSGDADMFIKDEKGRVVAEISEGIPQELEGSSIVASISDAGEKMVYLPADGSYTLDIVATNEGTVNYSVKEYSRESSTYAKITNYYDVPVAAGETVTGVIPSYSINDSVDTASGSEVYYALQAASTVIEPSFEAKGENASKAVHKVSFVEDDFDGIVVAGAGEYVEGSIARIVAIPPEGYGFIGWFVGDELVSEEPEYEFTVTTDVEFRAEFSK